MTNSIVITYFSLIIYHYWKSLVLLKIKIYLKITEYTKFIRKHIYLVFSCVIRVFNRRKRDQDLQGIP